VSDDGVIALLAKKAARGVRIRILGSLEEKWAKSGFYARPCLGTGKPSVLAFGAAPLRR
jgi:hypothetical protein